MPATRHDDASRPGRLRAARDRVRTHPVGRPVYRGGVALVGLAVAVIGLVLVPYPGPGWLIVLGGVAIWATEFAWARRLRDWGVAVLRRWTAWVGRQSLAVRGSLGVATAAFVGAVVLGMLWLGGVPTWLPDAVEGPLGDGMERYLPAR